MECVIPEAIIAGLAREAEVATKCPRSQPAIVRFHRDITAVAWHEQLKINLVAKCVYEPILTNASAKITVTEQLLVFSLRPRTNDFEHPIGRTDDLLVYARATAAQHLATAGLNCFK